jgi:aryl-alcohol dehydrogenase-like predicted oxidoreductase
VLARVPFDEGGLTGAIGPDSTFPEGDFRHHYFAGDRKREVAERVQAIVDDLGIAPDAIAETALRFVLSSDAVSTVIPGMRSIRNVERNCAAGDGRGLPADQVERLRGHRWIRDFYR